MSGERVLLCNAEEKDREAMGRLLRRGGYEVLLAADGREGVEVAIRERPHLVLMDVQMPTQKCCDAALRIKARAPEVVVIALSGEAGVDDLRVGLEAGCDGVIETRSDPASLLEQVRLCLEEGE